MATVTTQITRSLGSALGALALAALASGCIVQKAKDKGVAFLEVHLSDPGKSDKGVPGPGTAEAPLDMPRGAYSVKVSVKAFDVNGQPMDCAAGHGCFNGKVAFGVTPGWLPIDNPLNTDADPTNDDKKTPKVPADRGQVTAQLQNGQVADVGLDLRGVYSVVHVWAEEWPDNPPNTQSAEKDPRLGEHYAAGTSEAIYFKFPSLQDLQYDPGTMGPQCIATKVPTTCDTTSSPLVNNFVTTQDGRYLVTGITSEGFFVSDPSEASAPPVATYPGRFNALFVFNFSYPDNLLVGDVVTRIAGTVQEFTGDTQLTFPSWVKEDTAAAFPSIDGKHCESGADCDVMGFSCDSTMCPAGQTTCAEAKCRPNGGCREGGCPTGFQCEAGGCRMRPTKITEDSCSFALTQGNNQNLCGDSSRDVALESLESDRVEVTEAYMPTSFVNCDFNGDGNVANKTPNAECDAECQCKLDCIAKEGCTELSAMHGFGQYAVTMAGAKKFKINIITRDSSPTVVPTQATNNDPVSPSLAYAGVKVRVRGNLRQTLPARPKWSIVAEEKQDFCCLETDERKCLEIPKCEGP